MCNEVNQELLERSNYYSPKEELVEASVEDPEQAKDAYDKMGSYSMGQLIPDPEPVVLVERLGPQYNAQLAPVVTKPSKTSNPTEKVIENKKKCPICKRRFPVLYTHLYDVHVRRGQLKCPICSKELGRKDYLKTHMLVHTNERPFSCTQCPRKFTQRSAVDVHIMRVHNRGMNNKDMQRFYKCPLCDYLNTKFQLRIHFVSHTKERPYKCKFCNLDYTHRINVVKHIQKEHPGQSEVKGIILKKGSIFHKENPWEEMGYSLDDNTNSGKSDEEKDTSTKPRIRVKRVGLQWFPKCNECKKCFPNLTELKVHLKTHKKRHTHPFECKLCGNFFKDKYILNKHVKKHTHETPYVCSICGYAFKNKNYINTHMKRSHPETALVE